MTEAEREAEVLRAKVQDEQLRTFSYMRLVRRMSPRELETSGHRGKSTADALQSVFDAAQVRIEKLIVEYERKYPD